MSRRRVAVEFVAELARFRRGMRDGADDVRKLKDEATSAQVEVAKLGEAGEKAGKQLGDGIVKGADGRLRDAKGRFVKAGEGAGQNFGDGFERGSRRRLAAFSKAFGGALGGVSEVGGALPWKGLAAIPVGAAAAAASLQTIPPVLAAIGGGLGAIPSLAAGAAGSIGTLKLGLAGVGDTIGELFEPAKDADPFDSLSRNAQRFVTQVERQQNALFGLRRLAQDRIFAGLDKELADFSKVALPFAGAQVIRFGDTWNQTFKQVARLGRDPQFLAGLDVAFTAGDRFFDKVNTRIPQTGRALSQMFVASAPFVDRFGDSLLSYVDDFEAFIDRSAKSGALDQFFRDAAEQADALLDIGKEIFRIVAKIGGMQQGSTLLRDMADALQRFNDEAHNMESLEGIVATGNAAIKGMAEVLVVLGETLGETLADEGTRQAVVVFFDVLKVGAQIVGELARLFSMLPDPIQSAVLAGAGLAIVANKMFSAVDRVSDAVGRATDRFGKLGSAGDGAARGMGKIADVAGKVGVIGTAALIGYEGFKALGDWIDSWTDPIVRDVGKMTDSLKEFADTGKATGELAKTFGADLAGLARDLEVAARAQAKLNEINKNPNASVFAGRGAGLAPLAGVKAKAEVDLKQPTENIKAVDEALANIVKSGNATAAKIAFEQLTAATGVAIDQLPLYGEAINGANAANSGLALGFGTISANAITMNNSLQDAIAKGQTLISVWQQLNGASLSTDQAMLAAQESIKAVAESFAENGRAVEGNSAAALRNRIAVGEAAQAAAEAAQRKYEETGSVELANDVYNGYIAQLRKTLDQANLTDGQIETLVASYASMPRSVTTKVTANTEPALAAANALVSRINNMRARISVTAVGTTSFGGGARTGEGYSTGQRWGGVYERAQVGLLREAQIYSTRNPGRYMMAEPATRGEAFIPRNGNAERSVSIGRRAMEWYGYDVVPKGVMRAVWGAAMSLAASQAPSAPVTYDNRAYIYPLKTDFGLHDLERLQRRQETRARVGRPK